MTIQPDPVPLVPSTPNPQTTALVAALLRHILTILSGFGLTVGVYNDSTLTVIAGALVSVATISWSIYQKVQAARKDNAGSVRSAELGKPVKVA